MTQNQKQEIRLLTEQYCKGFESQAKAVATLKDVSEATIIQMLKNRWDNITNEKWRIVGKQVGWNETRKAPVETLDFETLILYYSIAKENGATFAITGKAGFGKTFSAKWYRDNMKGRNVHYLECASYLNKKYFLIELIQAMGKNPAGMNVYEMMKYVVSELRKQEHPLIILDEVDKLKDDVLQFFITLYNELNGLCGIVWISTDSIKKRIAAGVRLNKSGYNEIYRRIGRAFIELRGTDFNEVKRICHSNGITEPEEIQKAFNQYDGDLSRIDRITLKNKVKEARGKKKTA